MNVDTCVREMTAVDDAIVKGISITLTSEEKELFETLDAVGRAYGEGIIDYRPDASTDNSKCTNSMEDTSNAAEEDKNGERKDRKMEIRIAGGWVRDKLLGLSSDDVDIAVDIMSGHQFATLVRRYLILHQIQPARISVIAANPSQSKHLETATMKIHGMECDMVHLRGGEVYSDTSRIPTLKEHPTPLDDALRRDFTVNALFYNVTHARLEDWTGRGVGDLLSEPRSSRRLTTPLDAEQTFRDDPLRILRAVRFGVRFDIRLHDDIARAAEMEGVRQSLMVKVSRERVGKELDGMLVGKAARPSVALVLLVHLGLADCVFSFPAAVHVHGNLEGSKYGTNEEPLDHRNRGWHESQQMVQCASEILPNFQNSIAQLVQLPTSSTSQPSSSKKHKKSDQPQPSSIQERMMYIATFLYPFRDLSYNVKDKQISIPSSIVRESLKFKNNDVQDVSTIMNHVDALRDVLSKSYIRWINSTSCQEATTPQQEKTSVPFCRMQVGLILRDLKELWVTALLIAAIAETRSMQKEMAANKTEPQQSINSCLEGALQFFHDIHSQKLDGCWRLRPLLDGRALIQSLSLPRGPIVGKYMQEQVRWMLLHPSSSASTIGGVSLKDDCKSYLSALRQRELAEEEKERNTGGTG